MTVENPRGSVEKLSPKESVKGANTVLRGSVRAPEGFSEGKPKAAKPRGCLNCFQIHTFFLKGVFYLNNLSATIYDF